MQVIIWVIRCLSFIFVISLQSGCWAVHVLMELELRTFGMQTNSPLFNLAPLSCTDHIHILTLALSQSQSRL